MAEQEETREEIVDIINNNEEPIKEKIKEEIKEEEVKTIKPKAT